MSFDIISFHYPPELMSLLIDAIPLLNRSKRDVFTFFTGAGVSHAYMHGPLSQWQQDRDSIRKHEIVRQVLATLNERGDSCLRERREILRRVVEFENYSACWEGDRLKAKGLVAEIRDVVNVKDSFTRINLEREKERQQRLQRERLQKEELERRREAIEKVKKELFALFARTDPWARGKALEKVLNHLFRSFGIGVRDAFVLVGKAAEGIVEQIDGVVELDGHFYFVEMKWWNSPLGKAEIAEHLVRVYHRAEGRAIIISASDFTIPAVEICIEALQQKVVVLCTLQEIVMLLQRQQDLKAFLQKKVQAAIIERNPFFQPLLVTT